MEILVDDNELLEIFKFFKNSIDPFLNIDKYDKIGIINNEIEIKNKYFDTKKIKYLFYLDKPHYLQSISRWYNGQNRKDIFPHIFFFFRHYIDFGKICLKRKSILVQYIKNQLNNIINKLYLLKDTYNTPYVDTFIEELVEYIYDFLNQVKHYQTNDLKNNVFDILK
jgi:hypothetical protein